MASLVEIADDSTFAAGLLPLAVDITVTLPNSAAVETVGLWLEPEFPEVPSGSSFGRGESRRLMAIRKSDVTSVPRLTLVDAPLIPGGTILNWRVDSVDDDDNNKHVVVLIPEPA